MKRTLIALAIVLALCLPFAAHAVNVPGAGSSVVLGGGYCYDSMSTTSANTSNPDDRRAAQNCIGELLGGGTYLISIVVSNVIHSAPEFTPEQIAVYFFHVPTGSGTNVSYWNGGITGTCQDINACQWEETSGGTLANLYGGNFITNGDNNIAPCIDLGLASKGIHFQKVTTKFATWKVLPNQTILFC